MSGTVGFRESLKGSLDAIRPTQLQVKEFSALKPPVDLLTPGVELVTFRLVHVRPFKFDCLIGLV
jgi:hypothetical protein